MERNIAKPFVITAAVILTIGILPAAGGTPVPRYASPCLEVHTSPPGADVSNCHPASTGETFSTQAKGQGEDVVVAWDFDDAGLDTSDLDHIEILRGAGEDTMATIAEIDSTHTSFRDESALLHAPGETSYQIKAVMDSGNVMEGDIVTLSGYAASA